MSSDTINYYTGILKATVKNVTYTGRTEMSGINKASVHINVSGKASTPPVVQTSVVTSSAQSPQTLSFNESLPIDLKNVAEATKVTIELMDANNELLLASAEDYLSNLATTTSVITKAFELRNQGKQVMGKANISFEFKKAGKKNKKNKTTASTSSSLTTQSSSELQQVSRPALLRVGYYYNTSKGIVSYGKGLRIVAPVIKFSESSINYILSKINYKGLETTVKADESLLPLIESFDDSVDVGLTSVCNALLKGQQMVLHTKDVTVTKAVEVKDAAVDKASCAASKTVATLGSAKDATVNGISSATASTYKTLSGAAVYMLSYVPIIGKKVVTA